MFVEGDIGEKEKQKKQKCMHLFLCMPNVYIYIIHHHHHKNTQHQKLNQNQYVNVIHNINAIYTQYKCYLYTIYNRINQQNILIKTNVKDMNVWNNQKNIIL